MTMTLDLLDEALDIGRQELKSLEVGDVDEAQGMCDRRDRITTEALQTKAHASLDEMLDKIDRLRELQGQITAEARKLHSALKKDLQHANKTSKCFSAYKGASGSWQITSNRYVNKTG